MAPHPHLGWVNPVIPHESADPGTYYDPVSRKYYTFVTNCEGVACRCWYSDDLCSWTKHEADVLPGPHPAWIGEGGWNWAPEVISAPQGRPGHLMYISCKDKSTDKQCIGVAYTEGGPLGPYRFISHGPLISHGESGGCIDPQPFVDPQTGKRHLVFKNDTDKMYTKKAQLWIRELSEDGLGFAADRVALQAPSSKYQHDLLEAPYLTYHAPSRTYCLFYSSGTFTTEGYATSYSISRSGLHGPYVPSGRPLLYTDVPRGIRGPGGACVIQGVEGHWFILFHSLEREGGARRTCIHRLEWEEDGTPRLPGRPCEGKRIRLGAEHEDDQAHGFPVHPNETGKSPMMGGHSGAVKAGMQKVFNALK